MPDDFDEAGAKRDDDRGRLAGRTDRYVALPQKTRELIEGWHDDDVDNIRLLTKLVRDKGMDRIKSGIEMAEAAATLGKWTKWVIVGAVGLFATLVTLITAMSSLLQWIRPPGGSK